MITIKRGEKHDIYTDNKYHFSELFSRETGAYVRSSIINEDGEYTGVDPFMRSLPALIDVGIMGHCIHGKSGLCVKSGVQCYQNGLGVAQPNMSVADYASILEQAQGAVQQCLFENEIVISKARGVIRIADINIGEEILGDSGYTTVVAIEKSTKDTYRINLDGGRSIIATENHVFPVVDLDSGNVVNKHVRDISNHDRLITKDGCTDAINEINIAKIMMGGDLADRFYVRIPGKRSVKLSQYTGDINRNLKLGIERSKFTVDSIVKISGELMRLLGYYVGDGSRRSYVMGSAKSYMLSDLLYCLDTVFPGFAYSIREYENRNIVEMHSSILHNIIFDNVFGCRDADGNKRLPNFIFDVSESMALEFLTGYFCDGGLVHDNTNGASITFNTSSEYLARGLSVLLSVKIGVLASYGTERGGVSYDKSFNREINRKDRYRIRVYNNDDIHKIKSIARFHKEYAEFSACVDGIVGSVNSRRYKNNSVLSVQFVGSNSVVDISVDSTSHLFVTSNGILSHNCALGGRGDPNKHENFVDILRLTREYGIVPNYTTSGLGLTDDEVVVTKEFCGAVAVSFYRSPYTYSAIEKFVAAGVTTNIHYVLGNNSIDEAIERLTNKNFTNGISAVVFLLHKPVGLGTHNNVLHVGDERLAQFFQIVDSWDGNFKIGFDSCSIPGIINYTHDINMQSVDTCEGARFSMYITPDMIATPCSFDQELVYGVELRDGTTIEDAWNSKQFESFRNKLRGSCAGCAVRENCMGGCPLKPEVVLCNREEKSEN